MYSKSEKYLPKRFYLDMHFMSNRNLTLLGVSVMMTNTTEGEYKTDFRKDIIDVKNNGF